MTSPEVDQHVRDAGQLWRRRSRRTWELDLSILTTAGITLAQPEPPVER